MNKPRFWSLTDQFQEKCLQIIPNSLSLSFSICPMGRWCSTKIYRGNKHHILNFSFKKLNSDHPLFVIMACLSSASEKGRLHDPPKSGPGQALPTLFWPLRSPSCSDTGRPSRSAVSCSAEQEAGPGAGPAPRACQGHFTCPDQVLSYLPPFPVCPSLTRSHPQSPPPPETWSSFCSSTKPLR